MACVRQRKSARLREVSERESEVGGMGRAGPCVAWKIVERSMGYFFFFNSFIEI